MSSSAWLDHLEKYGVENLDATSLRHIRNFARLNLNENAHLRATFVEQGGEECAREEWDPTFEPINVGHRKAIALVTDELQRRQIND